MHEVVVLSGKGGTGKTSLTAAFAHLAQNKVICDLDVDAPDLHLIAAPSHVRSERFLSGHLAEIDPRVCTRCGVCEEVCAFGAIDRADGTFTVDPGHCEGCKACVVLCPAQAIRFPERDCGVWHQSESRFGPMVHAQLDPGQENSGKLVTLLKAEARREASRRGLDLILSDGAPGVGCPVISSLSQATLAVLVTEPTPSGRHDLERVAELCRHFRIPAAVVLNKADLDEGQATAIETLCRTMDMPLLGRLPHDPEVVWAMVKGQAITENPDSAFGSEVRRIWSWITDLLFNLPARTS
ncbi:MAG: Benzoyl-CoA oxygenase component A [Acidobacteria bacterium ADurb.Bin340]|mgnify:CR=1 FL=1|nr:MAG: Benzoyl-CoA oxygenase component A [Acidobacteria bacterium ADurb.Bin340]HQL49395.1 ATP-binding protein [Holophaga sp.]